MVSGHRSLSTLGIPMVRQAPGFSGVIAIAASALFNFLFLWNHSTATSPGPWTEVRPMPSSAVSDLRLATTVGQATRRARPSTSQDMRSASADPAEAYHLQKVMALANQLSQVGKVLRWKRSIKTLALPI